MENKNNLINRVEKWLKRKIWKPVESTYLCLKYPFLYPRNRWTGKHYNNWKLHQYHTDNYKKAIGCVCCHLYNKKEWMESEYTHKDLSADIKKDGVLLYGYVMNNGVVSLYYRDKVIKKINLYEITEQYTGLHKIGFYENNGNVSFNIVFIDDTIIGEQKFYIFNHTVNKWLRFKIRFADFLNDYVLQLFHCIPTYTEIDAMKGECPGWYKRFGKQLLVDMKKQLKKDKMLYSFRIMQIKEKWGRFCLYCGSASREMYQLIGKYEEMSEHICIDCGKDADVITSPYGWMCPYCNECYENNHKNQVIDRYKDENGEWREMPDPFDEENNENKK